MPQLQHQPHQGTFIIKGAGVCDLAMPRRTARNAESSVCNDLTGAGISQDSIESLLSAEGKGCDVLL